MLNGINASNLGSTVSANVGGHVTLAQLQTAAALDYGTYASTDIEYLCISSGGKSYLEEVRFHMRLPSPLPSTVQSSYMAKPLQPGVVQPAVQERHLDLHQGRDELIRGTWRAAAWHMPACRPPRRVSLHWPLHTTRGSRHRPRRHALVDAESGQRGYLLTGDASYLKPYAAAAARLPALLKALDDMPLKQPGFEQKADAARSAIADKLAELADMPPARARRRAGAR